MTAFLSPSWPEAHDQEKHPCLSRVYGSGFCGCCGLLERSSPATWPKLRDRAHGPQGLRKCMAPYFGHRMIIPIHMYLCTYIHTKHIFWIFVYTDIAYIYIIRYTTSCAVPGTSRDPLEPRAEGSKAQGEIPGVTCVSLGFIIGSGFRV